ncbi:hypothetical protein ARMSODRAFT_1019030 [Armillaria solidipes]|uniref:Uncharacterized protein n=1 Tax=Armillaria solidipes TaxID=1076256 RepID=A0A2H3BH55_9AGAR|nr:hypothetical protein ARMSODRAFT_1019030 [Armillaria solidipes]
MALLTGGSLFETLDNDYRAWVDKFKVQRSPSDKIVYGREEVKMLIEEALNGTGRRGRDLAHTELSFYSSLLHHRPFSFALSDKKLKGTIKYPIIENVKINLKRSPPPLSVVDLDTTGGIAARVGFALQPVNLYWYNVIFDPTVWFVFLYRVR